MSDIVLTADRTLMVDYNGFSILLFKVLINKLIIDKYIAQ